MANMSAEILRNIVSSVFKVKPQSVRLSGMLPEDFYMEENNASGSAFRYNSEFSLFGFDPKKGFVELSPNSKGSSQNGNGTWNTERAWDIKTFLPSEVEDFVFFLLYQKESGWRERGQSWDHEIVTLYKAPDFHKRWKGLEEADIARWEAWIETVE